MTEQLQIVPVAWADYRDELLSIRFQVFVDEQGVPPEMEEDEHDPEAWHLLARYPDSARGGSTSPDSDWIGCGRLVRHAKTGHIGRLAVKSKYRARGIGSALLRELVQIAARAGMQQIELHAQCDAEAFYRSHGFLPVGEVFDEAGITHRKMYLQLPHTSTSET